MALVQTLFFVWVIVYRKQSLVAPNLLPRTAAARRDAHNLQPGGRLAGPPEGDVFVGVEQTTDKQVWFRFKDWLRHALVTGTTGSGKTELLIAIAYNFLCAGGNGLMFADPKADPKAVFKLAWIAKRFGREDDLLICNYITPQSSSVQREYQTSNTCNPTQSGTAKEIATMLMSLLPKNNGGNNAVFADNAATLIQVLSRCLVDLRNKGKLILSWRVFREYLTLAECINLTRNAHLKNNLQHEMSLFIFSIAGVDRNKSADNQSQTALDQFGYIAGYCQRGLATLTGSFGYIYDCTYGDISYTDVVHRKRLLVSVLPSLQNTQDEVSMLGKIDLLGKKQALSQGLASRLEGNLHQIQRRHATHTGVPSLNIMDEYKYISVPGMSVAATQGRSLGWASIIGVQSYAGLSVDGDQEADEWIENTSTKFIGSAQGESTFNKMNDIVGAEYVARSEGSARSSDWWLTDRDSVATRFEKMNILDIRDVRAQIEGEFTLIVSDREVRLRSLFVSTPIDHESADEPAGIVMNSFIDLPKIEVVDAKALVAQDRFFQRLFKGESVLRETMSKTVSS